MHRRIIGPCLALALAGAAVPAATAQGTGTGGSLSVPEQIGGPAGDSGFQLDIAPATEPPKDKTRVDQTVGGRDLCDPSVSEAERARAGVDCESELRVDGEPNETGLASDPLLTPDNKVLDEQRKSLGLGRDVPSTVILQQ